MHIINRRNALKSGIAAVTASSISGNITFAAPSKEESMKAGFSGVKITPPVGIGMTGFGQRDYDPSGSKGNHDDLYARAIYLEQGNKKLLIMGFDLLFFSRDEADRFKGAIGRVFDLAPSQILLNTSHTHTGPKVGSWDYTKSDELYLSFLEKSILKAAVEAKKNAVPVTLWAGKTKSEIPMNRRKKLANGIIDFAPNPDGQVCNQLPVCLFKGMDGKPVGLLFSISCHPSTIKGDDRAYYVSADYPGVAMKKIDSFLGKNVSLFLQGAAGDAKASVIGKGEEHWRSGTWEDVEKAGDMAADEVIDILKNGLSEIVPELKYSSVEVELPVGKPMNREQLEAIRLNPKAHSESEPEAMKRWAEQYIKMIDKNYEIPTAVPVTVHGITLGKGLRIIGVEGEIVGELGNRINNFYKTGITFPLGYSNGAQMYIPTSAMLDEGGYEVESYWEYRHPAQLQKGIEGIIDSALTVLETKGIK